MWRKIIHTGTSSFGHMRLNQTSLTTQTPIMSSIFNNLDITSHEFSKDYLLKVKTIESKLQTETIKTCLRKQDKNIWCPQWCQLQIEYPVSRAQYQIYFCKKKQYFSFETAVQHCFFPHNTHMHVHTYTCTHTQLPGKTESRIKI